MSEDARRELELERAAVAAQLAQIEQIQAAARQRGVVEALRAVVALADIVGATAGQAPYRALLDGIIQATRRIFGAGGASILLLDHDTDELVFEAASGGSDVVNRRFPSHQGIAGWVVMTGEPIAVADVRRDPRFAQDFAQSTGYLPTSIMATPLFVGEEVEGVLEVLDKSGGASFGLDDMETLALFARPAAIAVEQARLVSSTGRLLLREVTRLAGERGDEGLGEAARAVLAGEGAMSNDTLELARLVHGLSQRGERATRLARDILSSIARYTG